MNSCAPPCVRQAAIIASTDADSAAGNNNVVVYSLTSTHFLVDPATGRVTTQLALDREAAPGSVSVPGATCLSSVSFCGHVSLQHFCLPLSVAMCLSSMSVCGHVSLQQSVCGHVSLQHVRLWPRVSPA